jgi:cell division protease FtsH
MENLVFALGWLLLGLILGLAVSVIAFRYWRRWLSGNNKIVSDLLKKHFAPIPLEDIAISEREFPYRVRADLQRAIDRSFANGTTIEHFCGVKKEYTHQGLTLSDCVVQSNHSPAVAAPPMYEDIDIGEESPVRCLKNGLWLLARGNDKFVVLLAPFHNFDGTSRMQMHIATANTPAGTQISQQFFKHLEDSVLKSDSYRGKILSLEESTNSYSGRSSGIKVHTLKSVAREEVVLPARTLELLERNVIHFVQQRPRLLEFRQSTKKGILFYGPPGTGKTHTIHYLARALPGHTTLIITAEQVGLLSEYMTLARLLQPSLVVMEDVDLIAKDRAEMGVCEEVLLNKLLNEMDGLNQQADILFVLTTNRPEALERALASRPGRVDQAIEFPLPDAAGRAKLVRLYSQGLSLSEELVNSVVQRTEKVSAAFIKELMRRTAQFHLENNGTDAIQLRDVEQALDEMLFSGGSLNLKLLGAEGATQSCCSQN